MRDELDDEPRWWGSGLLARHPADAVWARADSEVTYERLRVQVTSLRRLFEAYGVRPGATVAIQGAQSFTQLWSVLALWSQGAQVLLMGPGIRGRELERLLDRCRPQFYVAFGNGGPRYRTFHDEAELLVRKLRGGQRAVTGHCLIHFTSGSTGFAKAVARTPQSLLAETGCRRRTARPARPG
ncbi:AMP-binding protein [Streptomyces sp. NPDC047917]|uniref:AMP-binding protein n=1 Tax=Streptomyces sp. NPDC047917 TaxID=3365491 RepID=UPI003720C360